MQKKRAKKNKNLDKAKMLMILVFIFSKCIWSQENELLSPKKINNTNQSEAKLRLDKFLISQELIKVNTSENIEKLNSFKKEDFLPFQDDTNKRAESFYKFFLKDKNIDTSKVKKIVEELPIKISDQVRPPKQYKPSEKFHWKPAMAQSMLFLAIQHGSRMAQKKTRRELNGRFFAEWGISAKNLGGWRDGDSFITNYIAHPMQGAVTGRIFINNSDKSKKLEFGKSKEYWESRAKAMVWSAIWSTQFEIGPISEASIGNVGLYDKQGPNRMGWVDIVVTPTAGTGVLIGEDVIDKYILRKWLEKGNSRTRIKIFRTFFTPFQSFTNVLSGKVPWKRGNR